MKAKLIFSIFCIFIFTGCFTPESGEKANFQEVDIDYGDDGTCEDCGDYSYANGLLGEAWIALENSAKENLAALHLGGASCVPIKRCGSFDFSDIDTEFVYCQDDPTNDSITKGACDTSSTGYFTWKAYTSPNIGSVIDFNNYEFTHDGKTFYATGTVVITITDAGTESGYSNTHTDGTDIVFTGDWNGTLVDDATITSSNKSGGSYEITCSDTNCHSSAVTYNIARVDDETALSEQED